MKVEKIERKEIGGGNLKGGTEIGEGTAGEHMVDGERFFREVVIALEGK